MNDIVANTRPVDGTKPVFQLPKGATDCHVHLYLPNHPLQDYGPKITEWAVVKDYRRYQRWLGLERVVLTQPNGYHFDNSALLEALSEFGLKVARGVAVVTPNTTTRELIQWNEAGVRGARIMNLPGGAVMQADMPAVEKLIRPLGWHMIVQFNGYELDDYLEGLERIECNYVIDHIGKFMPPVPANDPRVDSILRLLDKGNAWFKVCGAYEASLTGGPEWTDIGAIARRIIHHAPERMIWGSNWPHVGVPRSQYPDDVAQINVLRDWANAEERLKMLVENPAKLYGFKN